MKLSIKHSKPKPKRNTMKTKVSIQIILTFLGIAVLVPPSLLAQEDFVEQKSGEFPELDWPGQKQWDYHSCP